MPIFSNLIGGGGFLGRVCFVLGRQGTATNVIGGTGSSQLARAINSVSAYGILQGYPGPNSLNVQRIIVNLGGGNDDLIIHYYRTDVSVTLVGTVDQWDGTIAINMGVGSDRLRIEPVAIAGDVDTPAIGDLFRPAIRPAITFGPDDSQRKFPGFSLDLSDGSTENVRIADSQFRGSLDARVGRTITSRNWNIQRVSLGGPRVPNGGTGDFRIRVTGASRASETITLTGLDVGSGEVDLQLGAGRKTIRLDNRGLSYPTDIAVGFNVNLEALPGSSELSGDDDNISINGSVIGGIVKVTGGSIATSVSLTSQGRRTAIGGIIFRGGDGGVGGIPDKLSISDSTVNGSIRFDARRQDDLLQILRTTIRGNLTFLGGHGNDAITITTRTRIEGDFLARMGSSSTRSVNLPDDDTVRMDDVEIAGSSNFYLGAGLNTMLVFRTKFIGDTQVVGGVSADFISFQLFVHFQASLSVSTGAGDDTLILSSGRVSGLPNINVGAGDDFVRITAWAFATPLITINGGTGQDEFVSGGINRRPRLVSFEVVS